MRNTEMAIRIAMIDEVLAVMPSSGGEAVTIRYTKAHRAHQGRIYEVHIKGAAMKQLRAALTLDTAATEDR